MHISLKRGLKILIVTIPVFTIVALSIYIVSDFTQKMTDHLNASKDKEIERYIKIKKENGKIWVDNIVSLFDVKYKKYQEDIKKELQNTIDVAYENAHKVNKKQTKTKLTNSIKSELSKMKYDSTSTPVFLVDYEGNTLLGSNSKVDMDARTIVLEEIQKVRKKGEGFIISRVDSSGTKRYIFVKDLGINNLFIGTDLYVKANGGELRDTFLEITKNTLLDSSDCITVSEGEKNIYSSSSCREEKKNEHTYSSHLKALDLRLSYTFYSTKKIDAENKKVTAFKELF